MNTTVIKFKNFLLKNEYIFLRQQKPSPTSAFLKWNPKCGFASPTNNQQQQQKEKADRIINQTNSQKELKNEGSKVQKETNSQTKELPTSVIKEQAQKAKDSIQETLSQSNKDNNPTVPNDPVKDPLWKHSLKGQEIPYSQAPSTTEPKTGTQAPSMGETIKEKAQQAKDYVQDMVSQGKDSASKVFEENTDLKKEASLMAETVKEKAHQGKEYVQEKASQMKDSLTNAMGSGTQESFEQTENEEPKSIIRQIIEDHNAMRSYFHEYETSLQSKNFEQAQKWFNQLGWLVAQHSIAEELILYPFLLQKQISVVQNLQQHQLVKEAFSSLEKKNIQTPEFQQLAKELFQILQSHMDLEEKSELPLLEKNTVDKELYLEGKRFLRRKKLAPTHAHPSAPQQSPVFETLAGLLALPVDKFQDFFFLEFPTEEEAQKAVKKKEIQE